jgi:hypothetical protein
MALSLIYETNFNGVHWKSGRLYTFSYTAYEHDPKPMIIFINRVDGIHPNTGHQHRYLQGINLNYLDRKYRKAFAGSWVEAYIASNGHIKFTWQKVEAKYPYMRAFIRRYFVRPTYYIKNIRAIPFDNMYREIESNIFKDYSTHLRIALFSRYRRLQRLLT